jgi:hypothetical protein
VQCDWNTYDAVAFDKESLSLEDRSGKIDKSIGDESSDIYTGSERDGNIPFSPKFDIAVREIPSIKPIDTFRT